MLLVVMGCGSGGGVCVGIGGLFCGRERGGEEGGGGGGEGGGGWGEGGGGEEEGGGGGGGGGGREGWHNDSGRHGGTGGERGEAKGREIEWDNMEMTQG